MLSTYALNIFKDVEKCLLNSMLQKLALADIQKNTPPCADDRRSNPRKLPWKLTGDTLLAFNTSSVLQNERHTNQHGLKTEMLRSEQTHVHTNKPMGNANLR